MDWLKILVVSALPISELRGGIPLALYLGFDPLRAYILSILGNLLPVPFLLIFLDFIERIALRTPLSKLYIKVVERTRRKKALIERYGYLGLSIFVAIPLPVTGAWTGCLLAFLLGLDKAKSFVFIALGVSIAGIIVLASSLGVFSVIGKS